MAANSYDNIVNSKKIATVESHPYVVKNTGYIPANSRFTAFENSCCFIATHDKIHHLGSKSEISVHELRILSEFPNEPIFFDTKLHSAGFLRMTRILNIGVVFYRLVDNKLSVADVFNFESPNIVHILSWGAHFELLVTEQEKNELSGSTEFRSVNRNIERYVVIKTEKEKEIEKVLKQIEFLRKRVAVTDCIKSVETQINSVQSKLTSSKNDVSDSDFEKLLEASAQFEELKTKLETLSKITILEQQLFKLMS